MGRPRLEVPEAVRLKVTASGPDGVRWLGCLGDVVRDLERTWGIAVGGPLSGGSESFVAIARRVGGEDVVLKVASPGNRLFENEVETLRAAGGDGYVELLEHDEPRRAILLERLGPSLATFALPVRAQVEILCATLQRAWKAPPHPSLETGAEKARWLSGFVVATWDELRRPCSERVVERALAFAAARAASFDPDRAVLVHGDGHSGNALLDPKQASSRPRFKFIDPDGLLAEPAYDLAIPMREWSGELLDGDPVRLGRERCAYLSALTGVEAQPIWEWGFLERVSTGLLALRGGAHDVGTEMLAVAARWAEER